jgi:capsular polysaccharide biosynthesis protein
MIEQKFLVIPEIIVKTLSPKNLVKHDEQYFKEAYKKELPPVYIRNFENINLTDDGILFKKLKVYPYNLIYEKHIKYFNEIYLLKRYFFSKKTILKKKIDYFLIFDYWSNGYFHWMSDVLPRLEVLSWYFENINLVLPQYFQHKFIYESLNAYNIKNLEFIPSKSYININRLLMIDHIIPTGIFNPKVTNILSERLIQKFYIKNFMQYDKIYISRQNAKRRKVINEENVISILEKYGFKILFSENLSLAEQITIFNNASVVIGLHGGGLTNIMFMKENSSVLELKLKGDSDNHCYFFLANAKNLNYYYLFGNSPVMSNDVQNSDIIIDLVELKNIVEQILSNKR